jgi:hypothetical protein
VFILFGWKRIPSRIIRELPLALLRAQTAQLLGSDLQWVVFPILILLEENVLIGITHYRCSWLLAPLQPG